MTGSNVFKVTDQPSVSRDRMAHNESTVGTVTYNYLADSDSTVSTVTCSYLPDRPSTFTDNYLANNDEGTDSLTDLIHWTLVFVVTPAVSILGILGNSLSLCVLVKQGLRKSSNILLFSLAISDILFMIGINGPPKPMYEWGSGGFVFPEMSARILYYMYHIFDSLNWGSGPTSLFIPVLITVERLIAVYLPLHFSSLVTPGRTLVAVLIPTVVSYAIQVYVRNWFTFVYVLHPVRNVSVGYAARTAMYRSQRDVSTILELMVNSLFFLVIFVFCGCVAIGVRIKIASHKRLKMTSSSIQPSEGRKHEPRTSKTTKMLLCVCVFYTIACTPIGLPFFIPGFMVFPLYTENPNFRSVGVFVYHVYKLVFSINASVNFIIYMAISYRFRQTLKQIFMC